MTLQPTLITDVSPWTNCNDASQLATVQKGLVHWIRVVDKVVVTTRKATGAGFLTTLQQQFGDYFEIIPGILAYEFFPSQFDDIDDWRDMQAHADRLQRITGSESLLLDCEWAQYGYYGVTVPGVYEPDSITLSTLTKSLFQTGWSDRFKRIMVSPSVLSDPTKTDDSYNLMIAQLAGYRQFTLVDTVSAGGPDSLVNNLAERALLDTLPAPRVVWLYFDESSYWDYDEVKEAVRNGRVIGDCLIWTGIATFQEGSRQIVNALVR